MKIRINIKRELFKFGIAAMSIMTLTGVASAQDSFEVKIKYTPDASVEESYTALEKQAQKYCLREARRINDQGLPRKLRTEYVRNCVGQVMGNVLLKIQDDRLIAYHKVQQAEPTSVAANISNYTN